MPLGGVGEFGMNCMAVRYGDDMILVDTGMGFPAETAYGVDVEVPDFDFLEEYRDNIIAIVITHGHEDHIGALPYVLKKFNVPVYASHFTMGLIEYKLEEHDLLARRDTPPRRAARQTVEIGAFDVEFIRVSHSLIDCFALAINTPVGTIIHTGDYKVDETPVIGEPIDLRTLRRYGQEGVLALTVRLDERDRAGTHALGARRHPRPSRRYFREAEGRIFVAAFASSIHRLQIVIDVAQQFDRKVCVLGRSMIKNVEIAERLGYLDLHEGMLVSLQQAKKLPKDEIVYLVTGSQGEPRAALAQLSTRHLQGAHDSGGRHGRALGAHHPRQRALHLAPHRRNLQARRRHHRREAAAHPRQRPRLAGGHPHHDRGRAAQVRRPRPRRVPDALPPQGVPQEPLRLPRGEHHPHRERRRA